MGWQPQTQVDTEPHLANSNDALSRELRELRMQVASLQAAQGQTRSDGPSPAGATEPLLPPGTPAFEALVQQADSEVDRHQAQLDIALRREPPDPAWTALVTQTIESAIPQLGDDAFLADVECTTLLCRFHLEHSDPEAHQRLYDHYRAQVHMMGAGVFRRRESGDGRYETTFFVARSGSPLPALEE